jgi:hypothetical protein
MFIEPREIKSQRIKQHIQDMVVASDYWKASWFLTKTFRFGISEGEAIREFKIWCKSVCEKAGCHIFPIASVDVNEKGRAHIHAVLLIDRDIKYRTVHPTWRCGYSWEKRFDPNKGGCIYLLTGHKFIPFHKPFCGGKSKCKGRRGCKAFTINTDWKKFTLEGLASASRPYVSAFPLNINHRANEEMNVV